jgi:hypothetical protein
MFVCHCIRSIRIFIWRYERVSIGGRLARYGWRHLMECPLVNRNWMEGITKLVESNMVSTPEGLCIDQNWGQLD